MDRIREGLTVEANAENRISKHGLVKIKIPGLLKNKNTTHGQVT